MQADELLEKEDEDTEDSSSDDSYGVLVMLGSL